MKAFSDTYANLYDLFHSNKDYEKESQNILNLVSYVEPKVKIKSILDMGCGTGKHLEA
jgi:predicted TPR repeat methyltransferase